MSGDESDNDLVGREIEPAGEVYDTSFEVNLDPEDDRPDPAKHKPVYVDATVVEHERRPIVPANLRTWTGIKRTTRRKVGALGHHAAWHGTRTPLYAGLGAVFAPVGLVRVLWLLIKWWLDFTSLRLEQDAASQNDHMGFHKARREGNARRLFRGIILASVLVTVLIAVVCLRAFAPLWVQVLVVLTAVPPFAHYGRVALRVKPIVMSAVVVNGPRRINSDVVLRAYYAAGLGRADKDEQRIDFGSRMSRDALDQGSEVTVILPFGGTFADAVKAKAAIASGLDVLEQQVYLTRDKKSVRKHKLYVTDVDPLSIPAGKTPLLTCKQTDIWQPAPFGLDERGRLVSVLMIWQSFLIGAQPRKGKALALDTRVPTPGGWTTMGELSDGDLVYDETGKPCRVVTAHDVRHDRPCYEVHFSDGSVIVADAEHLWQVDTRASRLGAQQRAARTRNTGSPYSNDQSQKWVLPRVVTTEEMLGSVRIQADQRANYSVRVAGALQADDADLPVPPYTLGAWLGDGTTIHGVITCRDDEIISRIEREGERTGLVPSTTLGGGCPGYRVYGLQPRLRQIGVLGNKHIPTAYLRASEAQRRALLAGLLDTDGYCQDTGVIYFAVTNERLARDVRHLVSTLGYKSTINEKPAKLNGRDCGKQWLVTFTPADKVFGLARKACRQVTAMNASAGHRFVTEIRPVPSVPVRCITVDSPNSLYLVGETCIPTHNTFSARLLALYAALDPYVRITIIDGKNSPDWKMFRLIAHMMVFGTVPTAQDDDPVEHALQALREIWAHIQKVNEFLSGLPLSECPEGKVTWALARKYPQLRIWVLVMEEFQLYYELADKKVVAEIADLLAKIMAVGPSAGLILISASQKPSGVGGQGNAGTLFNRFRDNHAVRFALRCANRDVSNAVLGSEAYGEGFDASALPLGLEYRGVGYLYGLFDETPTVRTHLADGVDAKTILMAARRYREAAGTLTGQAAGEDVAREYRDVLRDVHGVFYAGEAWISWKQIASRLAEHMPEHYADITSDAISTQLRALQVESKNGRDKFDGNRVVKGAHVAAVKRAIERKTLDSAA